ncbi:MAG: Lrp/AsnC family transcriptional regulator [Actinocatenispora sp.]
MDRRILETLQAEGRLANTALAERVRLSPSPCLRRVNHLEREGVITGYRAEVDRLAVGLGLTVFVELKVAGHSRETADRIEQAVADLPEVVSCHLLSGAFDFLLEVVVPDLAAYERLLLDKLLSLPSVTDLTSNIAIRTVKGHSPLPLAHLHNRD